MTTTRYRIAVIVEGDGEVEAVPLLVEKWLDHRCLNRPKRTSVSANRFQVVRPAICSHTKQLLVMDHDEEEQVGVEYYVDLALDSDPHLILVLFDADADDPVELRTRIETRLRRCCPHVPIGLVLPRPEYEVWFLAGWQHIRRAGLFKPDAFLAKGEPLEDRSGGCKSRVGKMLPLAPYAPTTHQLPLTRALKFTPCMKRSPSFVDLMNILECLTRKARRKERSNSLCTVKPAGQEPEAP